MWAADAGTEEPLIGYQVTRKASDWLLTGRDIQEESKEESGGKECSRERERPGTVCDALSGIMMQYDATRAGLMQDAGQIPCPGL